MAKPTNPLEAVILTGQEVASDCRQIGSLSPSHSRHDDDDLFASWQARNKDDKGNTDALAGGSEYVAIHQVVDAAQQSCAASVAERSVAAQPH